MAPTAQQYFSREPSVPDRRRTIEVSLRGVPTQVTTSTGVFSSSRLDLGTSVLLRKAPRAPMTGTFLDLGCGWGPIGLALAAESPQADVWAVDVNERAVDLCALNAKNLRRTNLHAVLDTDLDPDLRFDLIWSNPPIRVGKEALHALLLAYLPRLAPGGKAYLVVQRNLGADSLASWLRSALPAGFTVDRVASAKGYRLLEVIAPTTISPTTCFSDFSDTSSPSISSPSVTVADIATASQTPTAPDTVERPLTA
jgi:16S rRNA (guanine1207-N2)-methyltransferase